MKKQVIGIGSILKSKVTDISVSSFAYHLLQSRVDKGEARERSLVHRVDEVLVCVGQTRLLAQELAVKVAAVAGGFLWVAGQKYHNVSD